MQAYRIHRRDNVATLLAAAGPGEVRVIGETDQDLIRLLEAVTDGHKVALQAIPRGGAVLKYAVPIGEATADIPAGGWVHLHNCRSFLDERSASLDLDSGTPTDVTYE